MKLPQAMESRILFLLSSGKRTFADVAKEAGCSASSVSNVAAKFGKVSSYKGQTWTKEEDEALLNRTGTLADLAKQLGRSRVACEERSRKLRLSDPLAIKRANDSNLNPSEYRIVTGDMGATETLGRAIEKLIAKVANDNRVSKAAVKHFLGWNHAA